MMISHGFDLFALIVGFTIHLAHAKTKASATYYAGTPAGNACGFDTTPSTGGMTVSISSSEWNSAELCGSCITVTGPAGNAVKATVTDMCIGCASGHIGLSYETWVGLSERFGEGSPPLDVELETVPCGITEPILLRMTDWNFFEAFPNMTTPAIQFWNANLGIDKVYVTLDKSQEWSPMSRVPTNMWVTRDVEFWEDEDIGIMMEAFTGERILAFGIVGTAGRQRVLSMRTNFIVNATAVL